MRLLVEPGGQVQQMRALSEGVWPAALPTARQPFRSLTRTATMSVVLHRDGGALARTRRPGLARLETAVRRESIRRGRQQPCIRIVRALFAALSDPAGVHTHRLGAFERVALLLEDWLETHRRLADTETRMTAVLDDLKLTDLVTSITGLSAIGAAAILAETGDPHRFASARALVQHAGLAPREKLSGTFAGRTTLTGQGRPALRLAAWRTVRGAQRANPVYAARFTHLTTPEQNTRTATQAQAVIAATILRQLHVVVITGHRWDPAIATHGTTPPPAMPNAARPDPFRRPVKQGRGQPHAALRDHGHLDGHQGQPRPSSHQPDYTLPGPTPRAMQGQTTNEAPDQPLDKNVLR